MDRDLIEAAVDQNDDDDDSVCFAEGDEIQCNYKGKGRWLRGGISHVNKDGTYDIDLDNGNEERHVKSIRIRRSIREETGGIKAAARKVKKNPSGEEYFTTSVNGEFQTRTGKYVFASDGGDTIDADYTYNGSKKALKRETGGTFKIDDEIEGNYQGYGRWFKGSISYVNKDGTYDVQYADGDQETSVSPPHLRFPARNNKDSPKKDKMLTSGIRAHEFKPGDEIEGDFKGRGRWYRGKIDVVNKDGTYDVRYDDGDSERGVRGYCIRGVKQYRHDDKKHGPSVLSSSSSRSSTYKIGDPVKANYKCRGLWLEGKICQVNGDGTYTVQFHNGNIDKGVVDSDLVSFNAAPQIGFLNKKNRRDPESLNLKCDEEVIIPDDGTIEGKKGKGKGRWYNKGKVARMNINGTHDVQYDDCEVQTKVAGPKKKERFNVVGDIVECNYRGKGKWFKGQIFEINADGTYDILYDDGDRENSVERFNIRNIQKSSSNNSSSGGERDMAIKGGDSFRTCGDNDDDSMLLFQVGDNIEANFRGRGTWYEGTIVKKNKDGTFHVRYADGDEEYFVEQHLIRRCKRDDDLNDEPPALEHSINSPLRYHISSHGGDARESNANRATTLFCVGEEVQGNYKGKGKWYKCKI